MWNIKYHDNKVKEFILQVQKKLNKNYMIKIKNVIMTFV